MNKLPPIGTPEREHVIDRLMNDTGFYCRYVLGMDTDRDEHGNVVGDIGKGGIRDYGPHQEVISFLDDGTATHKMLWAPRAAYKSSMLRGFVQRKIIAHPNISILFYMQDDAAAAERCLAIREDLENNPILQELFPNMKGPLWKKDAFITGLRTDKAGDSPTLFVGSPRRIPVGKRPNLIIWDDIVTENEMSELALSRGRKCVERSLPLGARGCQHVFVGTPKHYADAGHWILEMPGWKKLVHLDVGFDIRIGDDKVMKLEGKPLWPHLDRARIDAILRGGISFPTFMSEYKLKVVSGTHQAFSRHQFHPVSWTDDLRDLTGYLLTDIAQGTPIGATSSEKGHGALNVLMYVGVDSRNHVTILDLQVGRWQMIEFCDRYLAMLDKWAGKVNHRAEVWEQVHSNTAYAQFLALKCKERGRKPQICWQKRGTGSQAKPARIIATSVRFQSNEVSVCSTVPRQWMNDTEVRELWTPDGYTDPKTGAKMPSGDLVEQFIRFPHHPLLDIPDTFALVDSMDSETGQRVCFWTKPSRIRIAESEARKTVQEAGGRAGSSNRFYDRIRRINHR